MFDVCNVKKEKKNTGNRIILPKKFPRKTNQIIFADNQYFLSWARIRAGLTTHNRYNFFGFVVQKDYIISLMFLMHYYLEIKEKGGGSN